MTFYLTSEGKQKLEKELAGLIAKRPEISARIQRAKDMGDLKENADYHDAKDEQGMMESRIREIQAILNEAQIMEKSSVGDTIVFGSKITVMVNGKEKEYEIVGESEASPLAGKISSESPLAKALLGRKKGDVAEVNAPAGKIIYQIKNIK